MKIQELIPYMRIGLLLWIGLVPAKAEEMNEKGAGNLEGIAKRPETEAVPLNLGLEAERKRRLEMARKNFEQIKANSAGLGNQSYQIGGLVAPVLIDDPYFVAEVLDAWLPTADADTSGKEMAVFANGLLSCAGARGIEVTMASLRFLDWLWKESPPPVMPDSGDPMDLLWRTLGSKSLENPELWRQTGALSPKVQARFWVKSEMHSGPNFATESELAETLRDAAKGSEISRTAFEWHLQNAILNRGLGTKVNVKTLLAFPQALKNAGLPPDKFAKLVCGNYTWTSFTRLENPGVLIAETPVLLDGLQTLPGDLGDDIILILSSCPYLWFKDRDQSDIDDSGASGLGEAEPLLEWLLARVPESSLSSISVSQMTPIILAANHPKWSELWAKATGKSAAGNVHLIMDLLEKGRVAEAVALDPPFGGGLYSPGKFTARMEQLVARLRSDPSLRAFHLAVRLSMLDDASSPEAPAEKLAERQKRLTAEFERVREGLSVEGRADLYLSLGIFRAAAQGHAPDLDEYAGVAAAKEFSTMLSSGRRSATANLYVNYACSRAIAGDLSGINEITTAIDAAPVGFLCDEAIDCEVLRPVVGCFISHANNMDVRLPKASVEAILGFAKALAGRQTVRLNGAASRLVYLAANDDASLAAGLKLCGLEKVKPAVPGASDGFSETSAEMLSMEIRVALLHPSCSKALLASLSEVSVSDDKSPLVPLLGDPKLRAGISPEQFVRWNRGVRQVTPEGLKSIRLYVTERKGEFDMQHRIATEGLLDRLENPAGRSTRDFYDQLPNSPWQDSQRAK